MEKDTKSTSFVAQDYWFNYYSFYKKYDIKLEDFKKDSNNKISTPKKIKIESAKNKKTKSSFDDIDDSDVWSELGPTSPLTPFEFLKTKIAGQDEALKEVSNTILRGLSGLKHPDKPIGVLFFSGPTGVGKTETAKAIAEYVGANFIRIDCGELSEYHTVSTILGSPPGYVGFEKNSPLLDLNEEVPVVLLFDEIEKAHRDLHMALLGAFDYGTLTDRANRKITFKRTLVILTSNTGAIEADKSSIGFLSEHDSAFESESRRKKALSSSFPPEFRNRLTATINFKKLSKYHLGQVLDRFIEKLKQYPGIKRNKLDIKIDESMREFIVDISDMENMGARPIERAVDRELIGLLAEKIVHGKNSISSSIVKFSRRDGETLIDFEPRKDLDFVNSDEIKNESAPEIYKEKNLIKVKLSKKGSLRYNYELIGKIPFYVTVKQGWGTQKNKRNEGFINEGTTYEIIYSFKDNELYFVGRPVCAADYPWEVLNGDFDFGFIPTEKPSFNFMSLNQISDINSNKYPFSTRLHVHNPDLKLKDDSDEATYINKKFEVLYKKDEYSFVVDCEGIIFVVDSEAKVWTVI